MTKEEIIKEYTEYAMVHLTDIIPCNTPNYEEVLLKEARHCAEAMYEMENNPEQYKLSEKNEPLLDPNWDKLPF